LEGLPVSEPPGIENWSTQVRKGLLELCILNLLAHNELHGYDIVKRLTRINGLLVTEGTLYPLLSRLRRAGLLRVRLEEASGGPPRKVYGLTETGRRAREAMNAHWDVLHHGIGRVIAESEANYG
jgi:PadR family transcriptional regulator, regulatory protein PadR